MCYVDGYLAETSGFSRPRREKGVRNGTHQATLHAKFYVILCYDQPNGPDTYQDLVGSATGSTSTGL
jgi:hypothetical protein